MSRFLTQGKTPEAWVEEAQAAGINISPRTLRERARKHGHCYIIGRAVIIMPEQFDAILEDALCPSNRTSEGQRGGSRAASNTTASKSPATTDKVLAHLHAQAQKTGSPQRRKGKSVVTSLEKTRH